MTSPIDAMKNNYPTNIRIALTGNNVADFNVATLGWLADPEFNLRPPYGSPEYANRTWLRKSAAKLLSQIEIVPKDNVQVDGVDYTMENRWLTGIIHWLQTTPEEQLFTDCFASPSGIAVTITCSVLF